MDVQCGMCGEKITFPKDMKVDVGMDIEGAICLDCQDYTKGYIYLEPIMADGGE